MSCALHMALQVDCLCSALGKREEVTSDNFDRHLAFGFVSHSFGRSVPIAFAASKPAATLLMQHRGSFPVPLQHWLVCWSHPGLQPGSQGIWQEAPVIHWGWQLPGDAAVANDLLQLQLQLQ
jgi:hypothetical protein